MSDVVITLMASTHHYRKFCDSHRCVHTYASECDSTCPPIVTRGAGGQDLIDAQRRLATRNSDSWKRRTR